MKKLLEWLKDNPVSAVSAVVAVICLGLVIYFVLIAAGSLTSKIVADNEKDASTLDSLQRGSVSLPNPKPNDPAIEVTNLVINEKVIERISSIFKTISDQQLFIKGETDRLNKQNHEGRFILAFDAVGSSPVSSADRFAAADQYKKSFWVMFDPEEYASEIPQLGMPTFRAGPPPPMEWITLTQERTVRDYLESLGAASANALTEQQAKDLYTQQRVTLMNLLLDWAYGLDFYADLPQVDLAELDPAFAEQAQPGSSSSPSPRVAPQSSPGGFLIPGAGEPGGGGGSVANQGDVERYGPFNLAAWASADSPPSLEQLWEGQVELWIIRDVMTAISAMNQVGTTVQLPNAEGEMVEMPQNVVTAPVKRLVDVSIVPYYVGIHTRGGMAGRGTGAGADSSVLLTPAAGGSDMMDMEMAEPSGMPAPSPLGGAEPGGTASQLDQSVYPAPAVTALPDPREPQEGNFYFGPTGRRSNSIYDVRHAWVTLHIQADQLPRFFEILRQTNFMTVIKMRVTDVDEYALLREGFVYGDADVVEVELTLETLWFRTWTTDYMPDIVKKRLVVAEEAEVIEDF